MYTPNKSSRNRLKITLIISIVLVILLISRLAYLQIVISEDLRKGALEQWTKSIDIKSKNKRREERKNTIKKKKKEDILYSS